MAALWNCLPANGLQTTASRCGSASGIPFPSRAPALPLRTKGPTAPIRRRRRKAGSLPIVKFPCRGRGFERFLLRGELGVEFGGRVGFAAERPALVAGEAERFEIRDHRATAEDTLGRDGRISLHNILFDSGQSIIRPESQSAIAEIGKLLAGKPDLSLEIVGHTDDTGTEEGNLLLSAARAKSVVGELVRSFKVSANRLKARGAGQTTPLAANSTVEGRAKNRRVELVAQK